MTSANGEMVQPPKQPWPNGVTLLVKGMPALTVTLPSGEIKFRSEDIPSGNRRHTWTVRCASSVCRNKRAAAGGAPKAENPVQDDYPAFWVRYKTGKQYLAWVAYRQEKDRVLLLRPRWAGRCLVGTEGSGRAGRSLPRRPRQHARRNAVDRLGQPASTTGICSPALSGRQARQGGSSNRGCRAGHLAHHDHRSARPGLAGVAGFPSWAGRHFRACVDGDGWHDTVRVSTAKPTIGTPSSLPIPKAIASGWGGIRMRAEITAFAFAVCRRPVSESWRHPLPRPFAGVPGPSELGVDRAGGLWVAWDQSGPQWGKDTGHQVRDNAGTGFPDRRLRIACLVEGKWQEPEADLLSAVPQESEPLASCRVCKAIRKAACG